MMTGIKRGRGLGRQAQAILQCRISARIMGPRRGVMNSFSTPSLLRHMISRRDWLQTSFLGAAAVLAGGRRLFALSAPSVVTVYKDPGCECCVRWIKHLSA